MQTDVVAIEITNFQDWFGKHCCKRSLHCADTDSWKKSAVGKHRSPLVPRVAELRCIIHTCCRQSRAAESHTGIASFEPTVSSPSKVAEGFTSFHRIPAHQVRASACTCVKTNLSRGNGIPHISESGTNDE
eukprot:scaffold4401_cov19-Tisochrysis_lutea.AAC.2